MGSNVTSLKLFTLSACPMGRSMGLVMDEVHARYASLHIDIIYVELEPALANDYRIKTNPTTLFVNDHNEELFRIEGFAETEVIVDYIEQLNEGVFMLGEKLAKNEPVDEVYTVYLWDGTELVAEEAVYHNASSISAPRIHAILTLLAATKPELSNPFPADTVLDSVQFSEQAGVITITLAQAAVITALEKSLMEQALLLTLAPFQITTIELIMTEK